ncbi:MAG: hypothetical protein V3V22_06035 [Methylococcales bacterium]
MNFVTINSLIAVVFAHNVLADNSNKSSSDFVKLQSTAIEFCKRQRLNAPFPPHPFTTDQCSVWFDGNWQSCCVEHDFAYWCGGSAKQRVHADDQLKRCVKEKGYPLMGDIMRFGVRMGGYSIWPLPWRWGYGWEWPDDGS